MDKKELATSLEATRQNATAMLASLALLGTSQAQPLLDKGSAQFGKFQIDFQEIGLLMRDDEKKAAFTVQFVQLLILTLIRDPYDHIVEYCDSIGQAPLMKSQPWYTFARFIRSAVGRGFRFQFTSFDRGLGLPVTWKERTITGAHDGQPLELEFFGIFEAWTLFNEMKAFATRLP
jgi:hypothetical protein